MYILIILGVKEGKLPLLQGILIKKWIKKTFLENNNREGLMNNNNNNNNSINNNNPNSNNNLKMSFQTYKKILLL